jgi:hypothetical protein
VPDLVTAAAAPDVVIVGPCSYGLEAAKEPAREIEHLLPAHFRGNSNFFDLPRSLNQPDLRVLT